MANVEHSTLTGASLHEPKGVAAASSGQVYVANGAGTGVWTSISTSVNPFGTQLLHVRDEKASGTGGGDFNSGSFQTRVLNTTKTNEISGASLASNQISLPAGVYWIEARAPAFGVGGHTAKLRNVTDSTDLVIGSGNWSFTTAVAETTQTDSWVIGRFTLGGTKTLEIQHRGTTTNTGDGFGTQRSFGVVEVFTEVMIWKLS